MEHVFINKAKAPLAKHPAGYYRSDSHNNCFVEFSSAKDKPTGKKIVFCLLLIFQAVLFWPLTSLATQLSITPYFYDGIRSDFILKEVDYWDENKNPLLIRHFNSRNTNWDIGLGPGWMTNFHVRILSKNSQYIKVLDENGIVLTFSASDTENQWTHPHRGQIQSSSSINIWHTNEGQIYSFKGPYLIKLYKGNDQEINLKYKNGYLKSVEYTIVSIQPQDELETGKLSFQYDTTSNFDSTETLNRTPKTQIPRIKTVHFNTGQILKYSYNHNRLATVSLSNSNTDNPENNWPWTSKYTYEEINNKPFLLLQSVSSDSNEEIKYDIQYNNQFHDFKIWKNENDHKILILDSLNDTKKHEIDSGDNLKLPINPGNLSTIRSKNALHNVLKGRPNSHSGNSKYYSDYQIYNIALPRVLCSNCVHNTLAVAMDSTGHLTGLAYGGKATAWINTDELNPDIYYTTEYDEIRSTPGRPIRPLTVSRRSKHGSTMDNQLSKIEETKILIRDSDNRPVELEFGKLGSVKIDHFTAPSQWTLDSDDSITNNPIHGNQLRITHESINQLTLANIHSSQNLRFNQIPNRQSRVATVGNETKRILAIESFRSLHDTQSCQVISDNSTIPDDPQQDSSASSESENTFQELTAEECEESEILTNNLASTSNTNGFLPIASLTTPLTHSLIDLPILSLTNYTTIDRSPTLFLDIRPEECQSYFSIPNAIQRGSLIENAVAQSDRYSSALSTVRWFPSVDFIQNRTAIVQSSRDLTASTYTERPERLYNLLVREAELVNTRFVEPLSTNGFVSAIDGNQSTTIQQNDIDEIRMEIIIQQGTATNEQLVHINRAAQEIFNLHGITMQIIEIP